MNLRLLVARRAQNLTQEQLAEKVSMTQPDISRIEKFGWIPPPALRAELAQALGKTEAELFGEEEADTASQRHA